MGIDERRVEQQLAAVTGIDDKRRIDAPVDPEDRLGDFAIGIEADAIAGRHERARRTEAHHVVREIELHETRGEKRIA